VIAVQHASTLGRGFTGYLAEIIRSRRLIFDLTRREFRSKYLGSAFGLLWAFIQPGAMLLIYFVVFKYCLPQPVVDHVPFIIRLMSGLIPWFVISDLMGSGCGAIMDNRFLVKKVVFRVSLLPVVRILTLLPVHLFFVLVIAGLSWGYGLPPSLYTLQIFYYLFAMLVAGLGWTWLVSAMVPFHKDIGQVVQVLLQVMFFMLPLVWSETVIPERFRMVLYLNPIYYIVGGYRDALFRHVWFWQHPAATIYFWIFALGLLAVGGVVFKRLRFHFADVL
jgi:lipopolysaccharide transport system permease protein/teichoic acid transport system permease protein